MYVAKVVVKSGDWMERETTKSSFM